MSKKLKQGDAVRTNVKYAKSISKVQRSGTLEKELTWITGLWRVSMAGFDKPQHVHQNFLERAI